MVQSDSYHAYVAENGLAADLGDGNAEPTQLASQSVQPNRIASARSVLLVAVLPAVLYLIYAGSFYLRFGYPLPSVHDEFSYLLAADTFAHFRLANPTPPMWQHFESIHINMVPTYGSMYPPAQGLFLAAGQLAFGHPWWGVVLSSALFVLTMGWASLAWLPRWWAFSANITALMLVVGTYWTSSYWGGSVAAIGGALILGAIGRWRHAPSTAIAAVWALGCVVLVLSRPYTGGILILLSTIELLRIGVSNRRDSAVLKVMLGSLVRGALPIAICGMLFLVHYCTETTGKPLRLPAMENASQYQIRRIFYGTNDRPEPIYRHDQIRNVYHGLLRNDVGTADKYLGIASRFAGQYGGTIVVVFGSVFAMLGFASGHYRWILVCVGAGLCAIMALVWIHPHYFAPYSAFLMISFVLGLRHVLDARLVSGKLARPLLWAFGTLLLLRGGALAIIRQNPPAWVESRKHIATELGKGDGKHLILVKYAQNHIFHDEWVYNPAEFSTAKVLWARWWTPEKNQELADAFNDRKIWIVEPDRPTVELQPYSQRRPAQ